jgi:hypothetical protein
MLQAGPLYGAFPVAYMLHKKARVSGIYLFISELFFNENPMLGIEIGYLGIEFTLILRSYLYLCL